MICKNMFECCAGEQWQSLLSVTGKDTRRGKERCTPMLALIFAKADTLLQMLFKVRRSTHTSRTYTYKSHDPHIMERF